MRITSSVNAYKEWHFVFSVFAPSQKWKWEERGIARVCLHRSVQIPISIKNLDFEIQIIFELRGPKSGHK